MKDNIVLIGFMGSGKSTVGKLLAKLLGYTFVDTDAFIEQQEGMTINDIFAKHGEAHFRALETEVAKTLSGKKHLVIATGGGMVLNRINAETLRSSSLSVWLKITPETVLERLKDDTSRPLLNRADKKEAVTNLLMQRDAVYSSSCDITLNADDTPEKIAETILSHYSKI